MKKLYSKKFSAHKNIVQLTLVIFAILTVSFNGYSQVRVPFNPRTSVNSPLKTIYNVKGDFTMIGNTNLTLVKYKDDENNSNNDMKFVDEDGNSSTKNSSSATLTFSSENGADKNCSNIIYAGLYWSGRGSSSLTELQKRTIKFKKSGGSYQSLVATSTNIRYPSSDAGMYAAYIEVTDIVQTGGMGEYWVADMATTEGDGGTTGYYGGWGMVVVYENAKMTWRDITVFDGYAYVCGNCTENYEIPVSGFNATSAGNVNVKVGMMAGEGDRGISGDYFQIRNATNTNWVTLNHGGNTSNNFFNSSIYPVPAPGTSKPILPNNTGIDIAMFDLDNSTKNLITNGQTSTRFRYGTTQDTYIIYNVTFAVDAYVPEAQALIQVDSPPGPVNAGADIEYTVNIYNKGNEAINSFNAIIPIPFTTFSPTIISSVNNIPSNTSSPAIVGNNFVWNIGTLPVPASPNDILASFTFKLTATENCALLANSCGGKIYLDGSISGVGANSGTNLSLNLIQEVVSGSCEGEVISTPLITEIIHDCEVNEDRIVLNFCNLTTVPISNVIGYFPPNSRFYNEYPLGNNSIEYTTSFPSAGTYYAYPPGSSACYFEFDITLGMSPTANAGEDVTINCTNTTAQLTATGGVSYSWSPAAGLSATNIANPIANPTATTTYTVTVTGANGCTATDDVKVTVDKTSPTVVITNPAAVCSPSTVDITAASVTAGSTLEGGALSYYATQAHAIAGTPTINGSAIATSGIYYIKATTIGGCYDIEPVVVTVNPTPDAPTVSTTAPTCSASGFTSITNYSASNTYTFSPTGPSVDGTGLVTGAATGTAYTVTATNASTCVSSPSASFTNLVMLPTPDANAGVNAELNCTYTTRTLGSANSENQEGTFSYSWSGPGGFSSDIQNPIISAPGTYTLTVTDTNNGCTASDSVVITQDITKPTVTLVSSATELSCTRTSITLSATGTVQGTASYLWSKDNNLIAGATTATLTVTEPGEYLVVIKDSDNGCNGVQKIVITQNILQPEVTISSDTTILTCTTESIALTATATVQGTAIYLWNTGATTATINVSVAGDYSVTVTDSGNGCSVSETVAVTQDITKPELTIGSDTTSLNCLTESITLTALATVQGTANYLWNTGATTSTIEVTASGEYSVTVTDSNSGCSTTETVTVTGDSTPPAATINGNATLTCSTESITLTATATVQGAASYLWNTGATTAAIEVTTSGEYSVVVLDSENGCTATATATVAQNITSPTISISGATELTCNVTSTILNASGSTVQGTATYLWNTGATTASITVDVAGDYTVTVTDSSNGCSNSNNITVTENYVSAEIIGGSISLCIEDVSLDLITLLPTDYVTGGTWTDKMSSDGLTGSSFNPSVVNLGDYEFTYTEPGDCGRIITLEVNVNDDCVVLACSTGDIEISKVVTPNGDGYNDNFEITGLEDCDFTFGVKIFNRWGKIVYESNNYLNNWNGRHDGSGMQIGSNSELPTGTYYYIVTVSGGTGFKPITGYIYLGTH